MTEDDLDEVLKIEAVSYPTPWKREAFIEEFHKGFSHSCVLTDDDSDATIMAYMIFWTMFEECHLLNVTVALDWRGLGLGEKLIRYCIDTALKKNCKKIVLEVRKNNEAALKLYQKLGFFTDQIKKNFYTDGEDAYSMMKYLEEKNDF